jgi:hypothetical protein
MIQRQALQERFVIVETTMRQCAAFAASIPRQITHGMREKCVERRAAGSPPLTGRLAILIEEISFYSMKFRQTSNAN